MGALVLLGVGLVAETGMAHAPRVSASNPCTYENGDPVSGTSEMIACAAAMGIHDAKNLNDAWQCVTEKYEEGIRKGNFTQEAYDKLQAEQTAWQTFYAASCYPYSYDFGREGHMHFQYCRNTLVKQRAEYLNHLMNPWTNDTCLGREFNPPMDKE